MAYNNLIRSDDPQAVTKLQENIKTLENNNEYMQSINDHYKKNGTTIGYVGLELEKARELDAKVTGEQRTPYPGYFFTDNRDDIKRMTELVDRIQKKPESLFKGWQFKSGEAVVNLANNRLQLMFNEKPPEAFIETLKTNGFHWARKASAWQRPLTHKTFQVVDKLSQLKPLDGRKPSDLQPKAPKRNEPER